MFENFPNVIEDRYIALKLLQQIASTRSAPGLQRKIWLKHNLYLQGSFVSKRNQPKGNSKRDVSATNGKQLENLESTWKEQLSSNNPAGESKSWVPWS